MLAATAVLVLALVGELRAGRQSAGGVAALVAAGVLAALVAALPTWVDLSGSVNVAQNITSTSNPGNLRKPLQAIQAFGVWLRGSYKQSPLGAALGIARALVAVAALAALLGTVQLLRRRRVALTGWLVLMLAAWLALAASATTWGKAKEEMLTSPVVVLLSWAGIAALLGSSRSLLRHWAAPLVALALAGGVLVSDLAQYRSSNLAPTARYDEMASLNDRFAGRGPALLTDFDECALCQLRDLDVAGPDFA